MTTNAAIRTEELGHRYRRKWAVRHMTMTIPEGSIYGFLGPNGAGKSTTIRMMMSLLRRQEGSVNVLGMDPNRNPVGIKSAVGYVPEVASYYDWMRVDEVLAFSKRYRPDWDDTLEARLLDRLGLDTEPRVTELSKGQKAKLALLTALAWRPKLLILDEPTGGLDPVARREFLEGLLAGHQQEGGTILVSSHLVNEISGLVDHVGLVCDGRMRLETPMDDLRGSIKRICLTFPNGTPAAEIACPGCVRVRTTDREAIVTVEDYAKNEVQLRKVLATYYPADITVEDLNLEEIFVEIVGRKEVTDVAA